MNRSTFAFAVQRFVASLAVMLGVATLVFVVVRMVPGDPIESILGEQALELDKQALRSCLRLDRPLPAQYVGFLSDIADTSLGRFCDDPDRVVRDEIAAVIGPTVQLAVASMLLALALSIPLGVIAAVRRGTWIDVSALLLALAGLSIPNFWLGPMLLVLFSLSLQWLPAPGSGYLGLTELVLPAITLGTALSAKLTRMTRTAVLEVMRLDHVATARAKGLSERAVIVRHALRNALVPVVSVAGLQLGALLSGAIIVEKVFARPGLGTLLLDSIQARNYALVQGCVLVIAGCYVLANLLTDITYAAVDPRVRGRGGDR